MHGDGTKIVMANDNHCEIEYAVVKLVRIPVSKMDKTMQLIRESQLVLAAIITLCILSSAAGQDKVVDAQIEQLAWLSGSWTGETESGFVTEEHWIEPKGGMMLAVNRTSKNGRAQFEFLRIQEKNGSLSLLASPGGRPTIEFKLLELQQEKVVFANPKHDFPQKITYRRDGTSLHVQIEAVDNGQTRKIEWTWQRTL